MTTPIQLVPLGKAQWTDGDGNPLVGGNVYFYVPGTTTPKTTWQDQGGTTPNTNPVDLNARGEAIVWGQGTYRQMVYDVNGNLIYDVVTDTPMSEAALSNITGAGGAGLIGFDGTTLDQILMLRLNRVVDSIASLRSLSKLLYARAFVTGYYGIHDGGGGAYQLDPNDTTSADNSGTIIVAADGGRWKLQYTSPVSAKQFGAYGDNSHDDTAAIQAALSAGLATLYIPSGNYKISTVLTIATGISIIGDGFLESIIQPTASIATFNVATANPFQMEAFGIIYSATQNSGLSAITVSPSSGQNNNSLLRDVLISQADTGVNWTNSALFLMDHCFIQNFATAAVQVSNAAGPDNGDSVITNCTFFDYNGETSASGIIYRSSGGLRVENNKFGALAYGLIFQYAAGAATSTAQLFITGNSFDTMSVAAISMTRTGGTDRFNSIVIVGNTFPSCALALTIPTDSIGYWVSSLVLGFNAWISPATGTPAFASISAVATFNIIGNTLFGNAAGSIGIAIGSQAIGGVVQGNNLSGSFTTTVYVDPGATAIRVVDNQGFDPLGPRPPTVGASPWTFSAGYSRTTLYVSSSTSITSITQNSTPILPAATSANQTVTVVLEPLESAVITYTGTLSAQSMLH